ncbi:MAG TPA: UbiD family decarboxylase, partial [Pirellulales bacterium]
MGYRTLRECVEDLERHKRLVRIEQEIDPHLEAAEIQRRVYAAGGPAILFANVKGCRFPMVSNLFGTVERAKFLFRDAIEGVRRLVELKVDPENLGKRPFRYLKALGAAWNTRPVMVGSGPATAQEITLEDLPKLVSWPRDGGPFVTLPQVYSEDPDRP